MKKILLVAICALAAVCCNAQFFVGGTFGVATSKTGDSDRVTTFSIAPTVGYGVSDNFDLGLELGYDYAEMGSLTVNNFNLGAFARYNFVKLDNFNIFGEAAIDYLYNKVQDGDGIGGVGVFIRPGVSYMVSDNLQILAKTNLFSYSHYSFEGEGINNTGFGIDLTNIQLGIIYRF